MNELDIAIESAIKKGSTDIHIGRTARIRVDGSLVPLVGVAAPDPQTAAQQILAKFPRERSKFFAEKLGRGEDIDLAFSSPSNARIRANIYMCESGMQIALRVIPARRLTATEIGIPFPVADICRRSSGLFVATGANGSGKTTTLAAVVDIINESRGLHILTIEDPIEYVIKSAKSMVSQREIGRDAPDFYSALRSAVRENPDLIVLGEMRDLETTRTAIELAETGHLVFATLHTRTAVSTIDRLVGQFGAGEQPQIRMMLSENLLGVLSQTLVRQKRGGMIAAFEMLTANAAVRNLIREQHVPQILSVLQTGRQSGMCTMEDSLLNLVERGLVSPADALDKAFRPQELLKAMRDSPKIPQNELIGLK